MEDNTTIRNTRTRATIRRKENSKTMNAAEMARQCTPCTYGQRASIRVQPRAKRNQDLLGDAVDLALTSMCTQRTTPRRDSDTCRYMSVIFTRQAPGYERPATAARPIFRDGGVPDVALPDSSSTASMYFAKASCAAAIVSVEQQSTLLLLLPRDCCRLKLAQRRGCGPHALRT